MNNWYDSCKFNLDYFNGVIQDYDSNVEEFIRDISLFDDRLSLDNWLISEQGLYNYAYSARLFGLNNFIIAWNPSFNSSMTPSQDCNNKGLFISISGKGLSFLQKHANTLPSLIKYFYNLGLRCSRFDVNCDIFDKDNDIVPLLVDSIDNALIRKEGAPGLVCDLKRTNQNFRVIPIVDTDTNERFYNAYVGHHGTNFGMFRCYNKKLEVKEMNNSDVASILLDSVGNPDYWYRLEYEVHKENADAVFKAFASGKITLQGAFFACADRFFTPVIQPHIFSKTFSRDAQSSVLWVSFMDYLSLLISSNSGNIEVFTNSPSIEKDSVSYMGYLELMKPILYMAEQFRSANPDWYDKVVLQEGKISFDTNPKYFLVRKDLSV